MPLIKGMFFQKYYNLNLTIKVFCNTPITHTFSALFFVSNYFGIIQGSVSNINTLNRESTRFNFQKQM